MTRRQLLTMLAAAWGWRVADAQEPQERVVPIAIDQLVFAPTKATARVGDIVEWENKDVVAHTATATNKAWDVVIPAGKKARLVVRQEGTFDYLCRYHPTMTARLVVESRERITPA